MINDLYNEKILKLASNISRNGRLNEFDFTSVAVSKLCGSKVTVDIKITNNLISDFSHIVKACALGQASSSVMASNIIGSDMEELKNLQIEMRNMLKDNGPTPKGKWSDLEVLEPVRDYKGRHSSVMLTFDAVVDCINQFESNKENQ
jgi:NifU-like protein involved in Fe-S cluster formation